MKPFRTQVKIGDGPPISVTVDSMKLVRKYPATPLRVPAELTLEFDLTPEFAAWWEAINAALPQAEVAPEQPHERGGAPTGSDQGSTAGRR